MYHFHIKACSMNTLHTLQAQPRNFVFVLQINVENATWMEPKPQTKTENSIIVIPMPANSENAKVSSIRHFVCSFDFVYTTNPFR